MSKLLTKKLIKDVVKSDFLYLMWKSPEKERYIVGKLYPNKFQYIKNQKAEELGFTGYPAFNIEQEEHDNPIETFMRRLPPKHRTDIDKYLNLYALSIDLIKEKSITDFQLLGYTGAYVTGDPFNFANPFMGEDCKPPIQFILKAAAFNRYHQNFIRENLVGKSISLEKEPSNSCDSNAVKLYCDSQQIGYIPHGYSETITKWINSGCQFDVTVDRINGSPESPDLYLFVQVQ